MTINIGMKQVFFLEERCCLIICHRFLMKAFGHKHAEEKAN